MFLYRKEGVISSQLCNSFIETFEKSDLKHPGLLYGPEGSSSTSAKKSTDISFTPEFLNHSEWGPLLGELIPELYKASEDYYLRHEIALSHVDPFDLSPMFNMQRYNPGEGFLGWHCERGSPNFSNRLLVWMVYLNTVTDRGETEFLYQHHFEEPKQGKLIIWPSDWMYTHRGISSPSQTKYILTGWFNMVNKGIK